MITSYIKRKLNKLNTTSCAPPDRSNTTSNSCINRLKKVAELGIQPKTIWDGGALVGEWTTKVHEIFPHAKFVVVEPNPETHKVIQDELKAKSVNHLFIGGALSNLDSQMNLNIWENPHHKNAKTQLAASSLKSHVQGIATRQYLVPTFKIDTICKDHDVSCDILKLDLQGAEIEALKGAEETLKKTELVITEFGLLDAYIERTKVNELIEFMYNNSFMLYDIVDLRYRPYDGAMCGGDLFFVKKDSNLKKHKDFF